MPYVITFLIYVFAVIPSQASYAVTRNANAVTWYGLANANQGANVILAHETLAGATFSELKPGDLVQAGYPDGMRLFEVTELQRYTATDPQSVYSYFINAAGVKYSSAELVDLLYKPDVLVLQTCYDNGAGRLFVIAERKVIK
jgi:hypothetical protein